MELLYKKQKFPDLILISSVTVTDISHIVTPPETLPGLHTCTLY